MKKTKIVMPLMAFTLAILGALGSNRSDAKTAALPGFYYNILGICIGLPIGSCDNNPFGSICVFNDGTGYSEVHQNRILILPNLLRCDIVLRHSQNDGKLN